MSTALRHGLCLWAVAGCAGNDLPPPGTCEVGAASEEIDVEVVELGAPAYFDDLFFAPAIDHVIAAPAGTGQVFLVEPEELDVTSIEVPDGVESADASASTLYAVDRSADEVLAIDLSSQDLATSHEVAGHPDYLRVSPTTGEVWVTVPARNRIEILDPTTLVPSGGIVLPGPPEGLTFDGAGRAYVNNTGSVVAIDVAQRVVVGEWDVGCGGSHGFPQVDLEYGLVFGGCKDAGGVGVTTMDGDLRAGFEGGGGVAVLGYDGDRHHLYLRSDPGDALIILAVCPDGQLGELARVAIPERGHATVSDGAGRAWVADATTGGLVRVADPFPGS